MKELAGYRSVSFVLAALVAGVSLGCRPSDKARWDAFWHKSGGTKAADDPVTGSPTGVQPVPSPLHLLLPHKIRIHPFTGTFRGADGTRGLDVQIEAKDAYGDGTKAFGDFRFELYSVMPNSTDRKAGRLFTWEVPLMEAKKNLLHWDNINRAYKFKLQWKDISPGQQYVLVTIFASPYTKRLFAERVFVAGQ